MVTCRCSDLSTLDTLWMMLSSLIYPLFQILLALSRMLMFSTQRITKLITKVWLKSCKLTRMHSLKLLKLNSPRSEISLIKFLDKISPSCLTICTSLSIKKEVSLCGLNSSQTTSKYQTQSFLRNTQLFAELRKKKFSRLSLFSTMQTIKESISTNGLTLLKNILNSQTNKISYYQPKSNLSNLKLKAMLTL